MDGTADGVIPDAVTLVDYRRPRDRNLDLTPLLDVVFQLLIFFMVSSQFAEPRSKIDLPMGKGGVAPDSESTVRVEVTAAGEIRVENAAVADEDFETALSAAMESRGVEKFQFHGDQALPYGTLVGLMKRAQEVGIKGMEIVTDPMAERKEDP